MPLNCFCCLVFLVFFNWWDIKLYYCYKCQCKLKQNCLELKVISSCHVHVKLEYP